MHSYDLFFFVSKRMGKYQDGHKDAYKKVSIYIESRTRSIEKLSDWNMRTLWYGGFES